MEKEARKTMRVVVYCRLARADQEDTLLEVQKERLRVYAKERGYDVVAEIAEIGSGLSLNRPGIREMAGLAYRHMIDAVLVSDISRLCRDCGQTLRLEGKLKKQGVSIESIKGNPLPEYRRARIALGCIVKSGKEVTAGSGLRCFSLPSTVRGL